DGCPGPALLLGLGFPEGSPLRRSSVARLCSQAGGSSHALSVTARPGATASCKLSANTTCSVAVADSAGCPWSFTTATSRCFAASRSDTARAVRTSPLCSPTRNSPGSGACTSS
uniref:Uncharacterized protein n=1 Tax=Anas zonorhyncha TaxID=75864 RepID=A0A8B9TXM8_9AVES